MSDSDRSAKIEIYRTGYDQLILALANLPEAMWQYRPAPDRWTIHEIIVHIADSEANSYVRCRRFLAEPGSTVLGYAEETWASALDYHAQSVQDALELFKYLRQASYNLIKDLPETAWANTVNHSESGLMTLDDWLTVYARHISDHIQQMRRVHADWIKTNTTSARLTAEIDAAWAAFEGGLAKISLEKMSSAQDAQGWNVRDHLTHLAAWEQSIIFLFEGKPRHLAFGIPAEKLSHAYIDEINATVRDRWLAYSPQAALEELRRIHTELMDRVRQLSDFELNLLVINFFPGAQPGDARRVFEIIQQNTSKHFEEHLDWIAALGG